MRGRLCIGCLLEEDLSARDVGVERAEGLLPPGQHWSLSALAGQFVYGLEAFMEPSSESGRLRQLPCGAHCGRLRRGAAG